MAGEHPRAAEVEDLPVQQVKRRRESRPGVGPAIAALALAGLLAGGFGILGGRPDASPAVSTSPTGGAVVPATSPPQPTVALRTPQVTPWLACGPEPVEPPEISLESNGVPAPGLVETAIGDYVPPTGAPGNPFAAIRGPRVEVRPDVITELWVDGGACALEWSIVLFDPITENEYVLHEASNALRDSNYAAQNRFDLSEAIPGHRGIGHDVQLRGIFVFGTVTVRAFWRLRILPLDIPVPTLTTGLPRREIPVVPGCDLTLTLGNRYTERLQPCDEDLSMELGAATAIKAGGTMTFEFVDATPIVITPFDVVIICGRLSGLAFVAEPEPGCWEEPVVGLPIAVPDVRGAWTLALSTCINPGDITNILCGTWYANVEVLENVPEPTSARR